MSIWSDHPTLTEELLKSVEAGTSVSKSRMQVFREFAERVARQYGTRLTPKACEVRYFRVLKRTGHTNTPKTKGRVRRLSPVEVEVRNRAAQRVDALIGTGLSTGKAIDATARELNLTQRQVRWTYEKQRNAAVSTVKPTSPNSLSASHSPRLVEDVLLDAVSDLLHYGPSVENFDLFLFAENLASLARSAANPAKTLAAETAKLREDLEASRLRFEEAEARNQSLLRENEEHKRRIAELGGVKSEVRELRKDMEFLLKEWMQSPITGARQYERKMRVVLDNFDNVLSVTEET